MANPNDQHGPSSVFRFLSNRVFALAGYSDPPTTYDAMLFYLPPISTVTSRVVRIKDRLWELWSPNSSVHAYYPGLSDENSPLGTDLEPSKRRSDGHMGRFDYSTGPQHYDLRRPWLGYMKKRRFDSSPENSQLSDVWVPSAPPNYGHFLSTFVAVASLRFTRLLKSAENLESPLQSSEDPIPKRPPHLTRNGSQLLNGTKTLDDAVDTLAAVQRDLRELDGWVRMAEGMRLYHDRQDPISEIPPADDTLIGLWINGCNESVVSRLIRNRIPCFIAHEADGDEDWRRMEKNPIQCVMMSTRTSVAAEETRYRHYERKFLENGQILESLKSDLALAAYKDIPRSMRFDRSRSSTVGQGWMNGFYQDPRMITAPSTQTGIVYEEREGKLIPPIVQTALPRGVWEHWFQDCKDDGTDYMRLRSKAFQSHGGNYKYYDRVKKRCLYLDDPLDIPKHYDADRDVYGLPGPDLPYFHTNNEREYTSHARSKWVYKTEKPFSGDAGKEYSIEPLSEPPPATLEDCADSSVSLGSDDDYPMYLNNVSSSGAEKIEPISVPATGPEVELSSIGNDRLSKGKEVAPNFSSRSLLPSKRRNHSPAPRQSSSFIRSTSPRRRSPSPRFRSRSPLRRSPSRSLHTSRGRYNFDNSRRRSSFSRQQYSSPPRRQSPPRRRSPARRYRSPSPRRQYSGSRRRSPSPRSRPTLLEGNRRSNVRTDLDRRLQPTDSNDYRRRSPSPIRRHPHGSRLHDDQGSTEKAPLDSFQRETFRTNPDPSTEVSTAKPALVLERTQERRSLISRISSFTEGRKRGLDWDTPYQWDEPIQGETVSESEEMCPAAEAPPLPVNDRIKQGITRFLVIWNLSVLNCWDDVLSWLLDTVKLCTQAKLLQVLRTNELGYQVFWLVFKKATHAESFRGRVASRYNEFDQLVLCDYVTEDEYSSLAGRCVDRWTSSKGLASGQISSTPFPNDPDGYLTIPRLASRLGIENPPDAPIPSRKKNRRKRRKVTSEENTQTTDGGAL